ncbi:hypothetical protein F5883DRAFT_551635 [Diaporthe sp. PMI_573]|nr:hypothetical protein F5883DRAFT_551635 [Diaporthaceae sp. PMI_573]
MSHFSRHARMDISHAVVLDAAWLLPVAAQQTRCIVRGQWAVDRVTLDILSPAAAIIATTTTMTSKSISPAPLFQQQWHWMAKHWG